jgi:hypothetical protein
MDLAQACQPLVQLRKSDFEHLPVSRTLDHPELLKHASTGQFNRLPGLLPGGLLRRKSLFRFDLRAGCHLLLLHRLTLPASGHGSIIDAAVTKNRLAVGTQGPFPGDRCGDSFDLTCRTIGPQDHNFEPGEKFFASRQTLVYCSLRCRVQQSGRGGANRADAQIQSHIPSMLGTSSAAQYSLESRRGTQLIRGILMQVLKVGSPSWPLD